MIVDMQTTLWNAPEQLGPAAAAALRQGPEEPWARPDASPPAHAQAMQPADRAVVHGCLNESLGASINVAQVTQWIAQAPDKLLGSAGIDPLARGYLDECEKICKDNGIGRGLVLGLRRSGRVRLWFSFSIAKKHRQRFRNSLSFFL